MFVHSPTIIGKPAIAAVCRVWWCGAMKVAFQSTFSRLTFAAALSMRYGKYLLDTFASLLCHPCITLFAKKQHLRYLAPLCIQWRCTISSREGDLVGFLPKTKNHNLNRASIISAGENAVTCSFVPRLNIVESSVQHDWASVFFSLFLWPKFTRNEEIRKLPSESKGTHCVQATDNNRSFPHRARAGCARMAQNETEQRWCPFVK